MIDLRAVEPDPDEAFVAEVEARKAELRAERIQAALDRKPAEPGATDDDALWMAEPIEVLEELHGLSGSIVSKLIDAGYSTLKHLADWTTGGHLLTEIDGIGPAKAEQIEEALVRFWAAQPKAEPEAAAPSEGESPAGEGDTDDDLTDFKIGLAIDGAMAEAEASGGKVHRKPKS